jgi:Carboxypeptidase regulatory-like domain
MSTKSRFSVVGVCLVAFCALGVFGEAQEPMLAKAAQLFGNPLSAEHQVFRLNDDYVIWLSFDTRGDLFQVDVGPKSYYTTEFPAAKKPSRLEYLSQREYEESLQRISQLKDIGRLQERHASASSSAFGLLNTDRFERAYVDRIVAEDDAGEVRKFNIYFLQTMVGSPEQVKTVQEQPMVCLVGVWYYLQPEASRRVKLGKWQTLQVAGPNLHGTTGCFRTTVLHDADGFTIEEPQNETIVVSKPYRVRILAGRVSIGDQPLEGVNVEVRRKGSNTVLHSKTNAAGAFSIPRASEGRYKFKATKDGFKALSGTVFVDRKAPPRRLSFELYVGT